MNGTGERIAASHPRTHGPQTDLAQVELFEGSPPLFSKAAQEAAIRPDVAKWFHFAPLADGSLYLRWSGLFEFLVSSDGRRIAGRPLTPGYQEAFQTYLLGQVLSFALLKQGIEPIHATAVVSDGRTVGFIGDCGYGKSSLGAAFLRDGYCLLTDDLLVIAKKGRGFVAYPGPPRIKLFPEVAHHVLGEQVQGTPMNQLTPKLIIPLPRRQCHTAAAPLGAIYVLRPPTARHSVQRVTIRTLRQRQALLALIANTFNPVITEPNRLARHFRTAAQLAAGIPVKSLSYPRDLARLPKVVEAVRFDLARG